MDLKFNNIYRACNAKLFSIFPVKFGQVWTSLEKFGQVWTILDKSEIYNYRASQCAIIFNFFTSSRALFKAFFLIDFVGAFLINCQIIEMRNLLLTLVSADTSPVTILKILKIKILQFKFSQECWMNEYTQTVLLSNDISSNVNSYQFTYI